MIHCQTKGRFHFTFRCSTNAVKMNRSPQEIIRHIASFLTTHDVSLDILPQNGAHFKLLSQYPSMRKDKPGLNHCEAVCSRATGFQQPGVKELR